MAQADEVEARLAAALPRADVDAAYAAWRPYADTEPGEVLATGSGWGALEVLRTDWKLPGTPLDESTLGEAQQPWVHLLRAGSLPEPRRVRPPGETLVAPHWRDMLETAATVALGREAIEALPAAGRTADARAVWERLGTVTRARGRFRLIEAGLLLAEGRRDEARTVFEEGFEVADLREGAEAVGRLWERVSEEPVPGRYDFRMR